MRNSLDKGKENILDKKETASVKTLTVRLDVLGTR